MSAYDDAREILLRSQPPAALRPQPRTDWTGDYPLPDAVAEYFAELGPDDFSIDGYGNPYYLPSLSHLWAHQRGYRTHGLTRERLTDWDAVGLVFGD